ncbi:MAG: lactate dehydrogenase, partial [Oscillatoriales cyanobacterium]
INIENFRGIEIRHFAAEVARLALVIAEYQCNVLYLGDQQANLLFLPLKKENWITCGNALRLDWLSLCPPMGTGVKVRYEGLDLWGETYDQTEMDFENAGGETYICGNPPYIGDKKQDKLQKKDIEFVLATQTKRWRSLDYICGFFFKAANYLLLTNGSAGLVSTNSICQGQQVPYFWPLIIKDIEIIFAHTSFKWSNLASHNAGVMVVIIGMSSKSEGEKVIYSNNAARVVKNISPYLISGKNLIVASSRNSISGLHQMILGNVPKEGGNLLLTKTELEDLEISDNDKKILTKRIYGSSEFIKSNQRYCLWIEDENLSQANSYESIKTRIEKVRKFRLLSVDSALREMASSSHKFREMNIGKNKTIIIPRVSSESRYYLPVGLLDQGCTITDAAYALYDPDLFYLSLLVSRLHLVWIATVCGKLKTDFRYSNTLGWNTFPVPTLTSQNKTDLTRSAENILLAREHYFPATIADMYDPKRMDKEYPKVREAHQRNDEILERIYIGRRFKNDTERLEKLFEMYTQMTAPKPLENTKKKRKTQP